MFINCASTSVIAISGVFIWLLFLFQSANAGRNLFRNSDLTAASIDAVQYPTESAAVPLLASSIIATTADHQQQFYYDKPAQVHQQSQVMAYAIGIAPTLECRRGEWRDYNGVCRKRWGPKSMDTFSIN